MKLNSINSIFAKSVAVLAACAAINASAGTAPAPKGPAPAMEPAPSTIGADLSAAFDTRYYFRGLWFADNIVSTFANISVPLIGGAGEDGGSLTWGMGAGYISTVETPFNNPTNINRNLFDYSELDLYTSLNYDAGFAKFALLYNHYFYLDTYSGSFGNQGNFAGDPEFGIRGNQELGLSIAKSIGGLNLSLAYFYDLTIGASYAQFGADYAITVTDWLSIVPAFQMGYGIDYYTGNRSAAVGQINQPLDFNHPTSGLTHMLFSVSAPMKVTKSATLTPYVALNNSQKLRSGLNTQLNEFFGGVKLTVTF